MRYKVTVRQHLKYSDEVVYVVDDFDTLNMLLSITLKNCENSSINIEKYVEEKAEGSKEE